MILLDTDTLTLLVRGHPSVTERVTHADDEIAISVVTRIEILQGRFDFLLKAANGAELLRAMEFLNSSDSDLEDLTIVPIDENAADEFDKLRHVKKLKGVSRADLLIASIALANRALLVTRNVKDFAKIPRLRWENWAD